jgi:hypothetical protein
MVRIRSVAMTWGLQHGEYVVKRPAITAHESLSLVRDARSDSGRPD